MVVLVLVLVVVIAINQTIRCTSFELSRSTKAEGLFAFSRFAWTMLLGGGQGGRGARFFVFAPNN
jgi:hypothetical protein